MAEKENKEDIAEYDDESDDSSDDESDDESDEGSDDESDEESDDDSDNESDDAFDYRNSYYGGIINVLTYDNDYILRGFRLFMNRIESNNNLEEDIEEESMMHDMEVANSYLPSAEYLIKHLQEQDVNIYQITNALLSYHTEYAAYAFNDKTNDVISKMNRLIYNYVNE